MGSTVSAASATVPWKVNPAAAACPRRRVRRRFRRCRACPSNEGCRAPHPARSRAKQAELRSINLTHDIDQAVAFRRLDTAFDKIAGKRVAVGNATARVRLDTAHHDRLEMQILNALALVHLEGDLCRLGTGVDQTRGAGKRRGIGVLILKAPGVGHQARQETRRDVRRAGPPRSIEELVHKDCGRGSRRHAHRDVAELFARGMMVDHHATASPLSHRSGILKTLESGNVDRDEQVVRLRMPNSGLQLPGKGQKAVYARDGAIVGKQKVDALVGKLRPDRSAEPENRAEGVTIGIRVPRDRDGAGARRNL